jgi:CheY-like chemotaxis protein
MTQAESSRVKILLVEDEGAIRRVARRALSAAGYKVVEAEDGQHALEVAAQNPDLDLLFTDVVMPNLGGVELAQQLCASSPELKVLYTSGYTYGKLECPADLDGAAFLAKPYSLDDMLSAVQDLLAS